MSCDGAQLPPDRPRRNWFAVIASVFVMLFAAIPLIELLPPGPNGRERLTPPATPSLLQYQQFIPQPKQPVGAGGHFNSFEVFGPSADGGNVIRTREYVDDGWHVTQEMIHPKPLHVGCLIRPGDNFGPS